MTKKRMKLKLSRSSGYWGPYVDPLTGDQCTAPLGTESFGWTAGGHLCGPFPATNWSETEGTKISVLLNEDDIIEELPERESINLKALFSCAVVKSRQ